MSRLTIAKVEFDFEGDEPPSSDLLASIFGMAFAPVKAAVAAVAPPKPTSTQPALAAPPAADDDDDEEDDDDDPPPATRTRRQRSDAGKPRTASTPKQAPPASFDEPRCQPGSRTEQVGTMLRKMGIGATFTGDDLKEKFDCNSMSALAAVKPWIDAGFVERTKVGDAHNPSVYRKTRALQQED